MNELDYVEMRSTKEEEPQKFDFNLAVKELLAGKKISGKDITSYGLCQIYLVNIFHTLPF
jgi:hypothetical protein